MPAIRFFEHIAEVYNTIEKLDSSINDIRHDLNIGMYSWLPALVRIGEHDLDIKQRTRKRLNSWVKKQITIKMMSL